MIVQDILERWQKINVLVLGDVMIDRYMQGKVNRISPEAPVPVFDHLHTADHLGGAANVALNCHALGASTYLCGVIGKDQETQIFNQLLSDHGLSTDGILNLATRRTTLKTRVMAGEHHVLRIDQEQREDLSKKEEMELLRRIHILLDQAKIHVVILQDYNKGVLTSTVIKEVIASCQERNIKVTADPKHRNFFEYKGVDLFKPNLHELQNALQYTVAPETDQLLHARERLMARLPHHHTLITLGSHGLVYFQDPHFIRKEAVPIRIHDVCGAGDTVISIASLALTIGLPAEQIAHLANQGAAWVCSQPGVVPVDPQALSHGFLSP